MRYYPPVSHYRIPSEVIEISRRLIGDLPLGRQTELARAAGVTKQALVNWKRGGVPAHRARDVAEFFGLTPKDIRPDIFRDA